MRLISTAFKYGVAFSRRMAEEHSARVASIEARLQSVRMEIDDDDEDVLDIEVVLINEAAVPLGGVDVRVVTTEGKEVGPLVPISSLGPGAQRSLRFHLHLDHGDGPLRPTPCLVRLTSAPLHATWSTRRPKGVNSPTPWGPASSRAPLKDNSMSLAKWLSADSSMHQASR